MIKEECFYCKKEFTHEAIQAEPCRHAMSPNSINHGSKAEDRFYLYFCSKECEVKYQKETYAYWAELDRNPSDSECFEGIGWEGDERVGRCTITGKILRIIPMMPGEKCILYKTPTEPVSVENKESVEECVGHFVLRKKYREVIEKEVK